MMKRLFTLLLACSFISLCAERPRPAGRWVVDEASVLSQSTESMLSQLLNEHEDSTSNQVVVLTIPTLNGEAIEDYAHTIFNDWHIGQADKDNGVLLLVSIAERKVRIEVGYGLEPYLTDLTSRSIIDNEIVPEFKKGDFDQGVINGVKAILSAIHGTYTPVAHDDTNFASLFAVGGVLAVFGFLAAKTKGAGGYVMLVVVGLFFFIFLISSAAVIWILLLLAAVIFLFIITRIFTARTNSWMKSGGSGGRGWTGGGWSGGGGGWSGGGGFSGGGGSSGGGGASGGW